MTAPSSPWCVLATVPLDRDTDRTLTAEVIVNREGERRLRIGTGAGVGVVVELGPWRGWCGRIRRALASDHHHQQLERVA